LRSHHSFMLYPCTQQIRRSEVVCRGFRRTTSNQKKTLLSGFFFHEFIHGYPGGSASYLQDRRAHTLRGKLRRAAASCSDYSHTSSTRPSETAAMNETWWSFDMGKRRVQLVRPFCMPPHPCKQHGEARYPKTTSLELQYGQSTGGASSAFHDTLDLQARHKT